MSGFSLISVREIDHYVEQQPAVFIIDLRPKEEYMLSHLRYAVNIPYEEEQVLNPPRGRTLLLYCQRGVSSMKAARELSRRGYKVVSVAGGITKYHGRNLVFSKIT